MVQRLAQTVLQKYIFFEVVSETLGFPPNWAVAGLPGPPESGQQGKKDIFKR